MARNDNPLLLTLVVILLVLLGGFLFYLAFDSITGNVSQNKIVLKDSENLVQPNYVVVRDVPQDYVNFGSSGSSSSSNDDDEECTLNSQCDDDDASTQDTCINHECQNIVAVQCALNSQCNDGNTLTEDLCVAGFCQNNYLGDCYFDSDCNDYNANTQDSCIAGYCSFVPLGGFSCTSDIQCADGNPMTNDVCVNNICQNNFIGECLNDLDCDDGDIFTDNFCVAFFCQETYLGDCFVDADCDDGNVFTDDVCQADRTCANPVLDTAENGFTDCADGLDNDVDGLIDAGDSDCVDLAVIDFRIMSRVGNLVFYRFTIQNTGFVDLNNLFWEFGAGDGTINRNPTSLTTLSPGDTASVDRAYTYPLPGSYVPYAMVDWNDVHTESNELNNMMSLNVNI